MELLIPKPGYFSSVMHRLDALGTVVAGEENLAKHIADADILLIRSDTRVDKGLLDRAAKLRIIATATSGTDHIDAEECRRRGIKILNAAGANADAVAEFTIGLMLNLAKRIPQAHLSLTGGRWDRLGHAGIEIKGKTLGLVGFGHIGRRIGELAQTFGMRVLAYDPYVQDADIVAAGSRPSALEQLLMESDFVSVNCNLSDETRDLIDYSKLLLMKRTAFLINTSRGEVVKESGLVKALKEKIITGAAVDVFESEPLQQGSELLEYVKHNNNLIITPHIAGITQESMECAAVQLCGLLEKEIAD